MNCKICKVPSGNYKLCRDCYERQNQLGIYLCSYCGNFHKTKENICNICEECGKPSDNKIFCTECYKKLTKTKNNISHNKQTANNEIIDIRKKWPKEYRCKDGQYVRSKAEKIIADWFYDNNIQYEYEKELYFSTTGKSIFPDFYIKDLDIYIEFFGKKESNKEYKKNLYKENNKLMLPLIEDHIKDIDGTLKNILEIYKKHKKNDLKNIFH